MQEAREKARTEGAAVFVCEAPLLFEAGITHEFDRIWVVTAGAGRRLERAMARDGLSADEARARLNAQMPLAEKEHRADLVFENDGDPDELRRRIEAVWEEIMAGVNTMAKELDH